MAAFISKPLNILDNSTATCLQVATVRHCDSDKKKTRSTCAGRTEALRAQLDLDLGRANGTS